MDQTKIGKFIAQLRKEKGLTQQALGDMLSVSPKAVSKWENGRGMPELSTIKPLCEFFGITINEFLSGERLKEEEYIQKLEENMIETMKYTVNEKEYQAKKSGVILMLVGFLIIIMAGFAFSEGGLNGAYSVIGIIVALIGFGKLIKKKKYALRLCFTIGFCVMCIILLFAIDYVNVVLNHQPPKFAFKTYGEACIGYETPFYNFFRMNRDTVNEYTVLDSKKKYTISTVPVTFMDRDRSSMEQLIKYQSLYVGDHNNDRDLINNLPLSEYGFVIEIDSNNLGLTVDYHITDWYINENMYLERSLLYNATSIFLLIDNVQTLTFNFSGNSYTITREMLESNYPDYANIKIEGEIDEDIFIEKVEQRLNDDKFVEKWFLFMFAE